MIWLKFVLNSRWNGGIFGKQKSPQKFWFWILWKTKQINEFKMLMDHRVWNLNLPFQLNSWLELIEVSTCQVYSKIRHLFYFFWYLRSKILLSFDIEAYKRSQNNKMAMKTNLITTSISSNHKFSWNGRFKFQTGWTMCVLNSLICFIFHRIQNQNFSWLLCFPNIPPFYLELKTNFNQDNRLVCFSQSFWFPIHIGKYFKVFIIRPVFFRLVEFEKNRAFSKKYRPVLLIETL